MKARGFSLVESLVGLVLLSLGLLGAWAMLLTALHSHGEALRRATASQLLRDMADRIRANPTARVLYDTRAAAPAVVDCELAAPCDPAQIAAADRAHFTAAALSRFPADGLTSRIEYEPATGPTDTDRYQLALVWRGPRDPGPINVVTLVLLARPVAG
jgi:type IV pilus modification protein PilV